MYNINGNIIALGPRISPKLEIENKITIWSDAEDNFLDLFTIKDKGYMGGKAVVLNSYYLSEESNCLEYETTTYEYDTTISYEYNTTITHEYETTYYEYETSTYEYETTTYEYETTTKAIFCEAPPNTPAGAVRYFKNQPESKYENHPETVIVYQCTNVNDAFNYSVNPNAISFSETHNINQLEILCSENG